MKLFQKNILTPEVREERKKDRFLLIFSGVMLGLSFPPMPFPFTILIFFSLIPYFFVISKKEKLAEINKATYITAFVFCLLTIYWVGSWQPSADTFLMVSGFLLMFVNPLFFLIPSTLFYFALKIKGKNFALFTLPIYWVFYEYFYMFQDASFPWLTLGNSLTYFLYYIQIADVIGVLGLSFLILYINIFFYKALALKLNGKNIFNIWFYFGLILIIIPILYGFLTFSNYNESEKKITVAILQPNLDPWEKWEGGTLIDIVNNYLSQSDEIIDDSTDILIWPETALPAYVFSGSYPYEVQRIREYIYQKNIILLTGMPDLIYYEKDDKKPFDVKYNEKGDYYYANYNGVIGLQPGENEIQRYGKMKLVPFGERTPFVDKFPFLSDLIKWSVGLGGWNVGIDTTAFKFNTKSNQTFYVSGLICYESIYPVHVAQFINKNSEFFAVVTNDSWYGNSSGPYQHKEFSVLRAIENRRTVIRSANGGISCVINPLGETLIETNMFEKAAIKSKIELRSEKTFYSKYPTLIPDFAEYFSYLIIIFFVFKKTYSKLKK